VQGKLERQDREAPNCRRHWIFLARAAWRNSKVRFFHGSSRSVFVNRKAGLGLETCLLQQLGPADRRRRWRSHGRCICRRREVFAFPRARSEISHDVDSGRALPSRGDFLLGRNNRALASRGEHHFRMRARVPRSSETCATILYNKGEPSPPGFAEA